VSATADVARSFEPDAEAPTVRGRRLRPHGADVVGLAFIALIIAMALLAPVIAGHDPNEGSIRDRLAPPVFAGGDWAHWLGTDRQGRDVWARIAWGSQVTLLIGVTAVLVGGLVGVTAGVLAGYLGGWVDLVIGRLADIQQAIPFLILTLAVVAVLGASLVNLVLVLGIGSWIYSYRVVRGEVLRVRERAFIEAARVLGATHGRILARHLLPNVLPSVIVVTTLFVPQVIIFTAGLSFLGLGVPPDVPEWGRLIADGTEYLQIAPWLTVAPSVFLVVTVIGVNLVGDWLRDVLDPRLR
jgi:peptide/nickel transport system permease protein